jgi:anti-sigma regulatory factor (Ser/Thr protein kinase)
MKEMTVAARLENIEVVTAFIDAFLEDADCPVKTQMQIDVAVDEVMSNIAHYAYPDGEGTVTVSIEEKENTVQIFFRDSGIPYDPLTAKAPDLSLSAEDRPIGGLGIHMVKKMMDAVSYRYENGQNMLTLQKMLQKG